MTEGPSSVSQNLPLVTVWVGCYNHARFVVEALESIRLQTYPNIQLIIWDDCSKDNSVELIENWINQHQYQCTFLKHQTNLGICRSINEVLSKSRGKYCSAVAADDVWMPDKTAGQVAVMEQQPDNVGVIYSDACRIDEAGVLLPKMFIENCRHFQIMPEGWIFDTLAEGNFIPAMTPLIRRNCFAVVGNYDESFSFEDWDMWLRISRRFKFIYYPETTSKYRIVGTSMTFTMSDEMRESEKLMFRKYLRCGWLSGRKRMEALDWAEFDARQASRHRLPGRLIDAAWLFRHRPCEKNALFLLCVAIGLPHERFEQIFWWLFRFKRKLCAISNPKP